MNIITLKPMYIPSPVRVPGGVGVGPGRGGCERRHTGGPARWGLQ